MGRTEPPFLYDPPSRHDFPPTAMGNFNPKVVTQQSWEPAPPRPQRDGPLINFNRHPDSYAVIPTGRPKNTMSLRTKGKVKYSRLILLALRVATLVGALGVLFCVICIKDTSMAAASVIRVGPGVSILHTVYGIFHLCRPARSRPPGSSAAYMLFAAVLDAGLIPLYVVTAIMAKVEHRDHIYEWGTLFETSLAADKIVYSTFLACSVVGGLHLAGLFIDLYLAIIFRKISKLPPDMNPLENNLTTRPHKHSKSEVAEKHLSGSTAVSSNGDRNSVTEDPLAIATRPVPFMHTRNDSDSTACNSQEDKRSSYYSARSHRYSRADLPSQVFRQHEQANQPKPAIARTAAHRRGTASRPQSLVVDQFSTPEASRPGSRPSSAENEENQLRDPSGVSSLTMDNWFTYGSGPPSPIPNDDLARDILPLNDIPLSPGANDENVAFCDVQQSLNHSGTVIRSRGSSMPPHFYNDDGNVYDKAHTEGLYGVEQDLGENSHHYLGQENEGGKTRLLINPLEMNPPTPNPVEPERADSSKSKESLRRGPLADIPNPSVGSGRSTPVGNTPDRSKSRYYGNLGQNTPPSQRNTTSRQDDNSHQTTPSKTGKKRWRRQSGRITAYESLKVDDDDSDGDVEKTATAGETDRKGRVISNTGIDLGLGFGSGSPGYSNYIAGLGVGRKRDVSGKVVEEGRGGDVDREDADTANTPSQRTPLKSGEIKAAGWARWRGF